MNRDWKKPQPIDSREITDLSDAELRERPMSDEDIATIERELEVKIPSFLATWFKYDPFSGVPGVSVQFSTHRDHIISENVRLRRDGYYGSDWPDELLWIGDDGGGGAFYADCRQEEDLVYYVDWEVGDGSPVGADWSEVYSAFDYLTKVKGWF